MTGMKLVRAYHAVHLASRRFNDAMLAGSVSEIQSADNHLIITRVRASALLANPTKKAATNV